MLLSLPLLAPPPSEASFSITIYFGKPRDCTGFGFCKITIGAALEAPNAGTVERAARKGEASATVEADKTARDTAHRFLKIEMRSALPERTSVMPVTEDVTLDPATSKGLGHKSITVLKGDYKIDYSKNKLGTILLKIEARD